MVDVVVMDPITGPGPGVTHDYAVRVQKLAQDEAKREGEAAVELIEQAVPPVGPDGQGTHVNRYA